MNCLNGGVLNGRLYFVSDVVCMVILVSCLWIVVMWCVLVNRCGSVENENIVILILWLILWLIRIFYLVGWVFFDGGIMIVCGVD